MKFVEFLLLLPLGDVMGPRPEGGVNDLFDSSFVYDVNRALKKEKIR